MQRAKAFIKAKHSFQRVSLFTYPRHFSALPSYSTDDDPKYQVLVEGTGKSRAAILNRPSALNALNKAMVDRMNRLYEAWEETPDVNFVQMKGNGRTFCSGSDVVALYRVLNEGKTEECRSFFQALYKFIYLQGTYMKPHVAILDGITMGCGAGIAVPGIFRVVTNKTAFSNPEAQIGSHPDAGASFYLSRLPGYLGEYLALTGDKLNGVEMIACGLATHYCLHERLALIEECLGKLEDDDHSVIETSLAQYGDLVYPDSNSVIHKIDIIDKCFSHDTVEEIIDYLENELVSTCDEWCRTAIKNMKEASPLSLKVILQSIREGRFESLDQCLAREYRISLRMISQQVSHDFSEGVRARLVDKDFAPKWDPPSIQDVTNDMVEHYFSPPDEPELQLPIALREPYT